MTSVFALYRRNTPTGVAWPGVVQAIVETFPNNCAIMFPQAPLSAESFSATFQPVSSKEDDDNEPIN